MSAQIISSLLIFAVGLGMGILLQRYILSRGTHVASLEKELDSVKGEQLHMKDSLQQHFIQTADLTQDLTKSYKALYEHLAGGASEFTEKPLADLKHALEQASGEPLAYDAAEAYQEPEEYEAPKDYAAPKKEEASQP